MLCSLAATCCLMRGTSGDILEADEGQAIVLETVEECHKVAAAAGCDPGEKGMQTIRSFLTQRARASPPRCCTISRRARWSRPITSWAT